MGALEIKPIPTSPEQLKAAVNYWLANTAGYSGEAMYPPLREEDDHLYEAFARFDLGAAGALDCALATHWDQDYWPSNGTPGEKCDQFGLASDWFFQPSIRFVPRGITPLAPPCPDGAALTLIRSAHAWLTGVEDSRLKFEFEPYADGFGKHYPYPHFVRRWSLPRALFDPDNTRVQLV